MTLAEKAIDALNSAGLDARKPANYPGECKAPYLVVQDAGAQITGKTTCKKTVVLYGYAPHSQPKHLSDLLTRAKIAMKAVPALRLTETGAEAIDDGFKALSASLIYTALCAR